MSNETDLSATVPDPIELRRTVLVTFQWGTQTFHIEIYACCICKAVDSASGSSDEIEWLHCKGTQLLNTPQQGRIATTRYLIPTSYVLRIAYARGYRIVEKASSPDLGVFPRVHPEPDVAMPSAKIHELIESLQVKPGKVFPLLYDNYVRDVSSRFEQALARIKTEHNFEFGNEFEVALCKTLRTILPQQYSICRGYVVSALGEKAGDDIIIYDRMRFPTLRALDVDDFSQKEQVPIEAVYAYIEAKHSICINGNDGNSLQKALFQVGQVKMLCEQRACAFGSILSTSVPPGPPRMNPAYGVIICRDVRLKKGDPPIEDPLEIQRLLVSAPAQVLVPPDFCVFGKNNLALPIVKSNGELALSQPFFQPRTSLIHQVVVDGIAFGAGLSMLLWALSHIELADMPWFSILEDCIPAQ